jgi:hypothetical protein
VNGLMLKSNTSHAPALCVPSVRLPAAWITATSIVFVTVVSWMTMRDDCTHVETNLEHDGFRTRLSVVAPRDRLQYPEILFVIATDDDGGTDIRARLTALARRGFVAAECEIANTDPGSGTQLSEVTERMRASTSRRGATKGYVVVAYGRSAEYILMQLGSVPEQPKLVILINPILRRRRSTEYPHAEPGAAATVLFDDSWGNVERRSVEVQRMLVELNVKPSFLKYTGDLRAYSQPDSLVLANLADLCSDCLGTEKGAIKVTAPPYWLPLVILAAISIRGIYAARQFAGQIIALPKIVVSVWIVAVLSGCFVAGIVGARLGLAHMPSEKLHGSLLEVLALGFGYRDDYEWLQSRMRTETVGEISEHIRLARRVENRFGCESAKYIFDNYVLSPIIGEGSSFDGPTRRMLFINCNPMLQGEGDTRRAANAVVERVRQITTVDDALDQEVDVRTALVSGRTTAQGFEDCCIAALRSVGIPARRIPLSEGVQYWDRSTWRPLPQAARFLSALDIRQNSVMLLPSTTVVLATGRVLRNTGHSQAAVH